MQGYDFMVGKSFVNAMDEALKQSRLVAYLRQGRVPEGSGSSLQLESRRERTPRH
jgi:hypothetical protein